MAREFSLYRIIEIEWAVKNGKEYVPTPKAPRQHKSKSKHKKSKSKGSTTSNTAFPSANDTNDFTINEDDMAERENAAPGDASTDVTDLINTSKVLFPASLKAKSLIRSDSPEFGVELTNKDPLSSSTGKRPFEDDDALGQAGLESFAKTPETQKGLALKRQKMGVLEEDAEWEPPSAPNAKAHMRDVA